MAYRLKTTYLNKHNVRILRFGGNSTEQSLRYSNLYSYEIEPKVAKTSKSNYQTQTRLNRKYKIQIHQNTKMQ